MDLRLAALALAVVVLAGCSMHATAIKFDFDGPHSTTKTHTADCDDSGTLRVDISSWHAGSLRVTVLDGEANTAFVRTYSEANSENHRVEGVAGEWRLEVEAMAFSGKSNVRLSC